MSLGLDVVYWLEEEVKYESTQKSCQLHQVSSRPEATYLGGSTSYIFSVETVIW